MERHLRAKHRNEEQVKAFLTLPKQSAERKNLVSKIRKEGNYIHNTNPNFNTGTLITCRRQLSRNTNTAISYIHCPQCKGSFSKNNIRHHYQKCNTEHKPNRREISVLGRYLEGYVHNRASEDLKKFVLPYFQDDEIRSLIVYDELIILMGNHFVQTYAEGWQRTRSDMRYLAKLKKELLQSDDVFKELSTMFSPVYYQLVIESVEKCAGFDENTRQCKKPAVVRKLFPLLIKALNLWQVECGLKQRLVKSEAGKLLWRTRELDVEAFRHLLNKDYPKTLNYLVNDNLKANKDQSTEILDNTDVKKLYKYLEEICNDHHKTLSVGFNFVTWKSLAEGTLSFLQVFNRARPGEVERLTIDSFNNIEAYDPNANPGIYKKLTIKQKKASRTYYLVVIRGNTLVISPLIKKYIEAVIRYRQAAGVNKDNPYVFGLPGSMDVLPKSLKGSILMVKFSEACGAKNPKRLRATTLRKHHATLLKQLSTADQEAKVDNAMEHAVDIHEKKYCTPQGIQDDTCKVDISPMPYVNYLGAEPQASGSAGSASLRGACSNISDDGPSTSLKSKHAKLKAPSVPSDTDSTQGIQDDTRNVDISTMPYVNSVKSGSASVLGACSNISDDDPSTSLRSKQVKRKAPSVPSDSNSTQRVQDDTSKVDPCEDISTLPHVNSVGGEPQASASSGPASLIGACSNISDHGPSASLISKHEAKQKAPSDSDSSDDNQAISAVARMSRRRAFVERRRWTSAERFAVRNYFGVLGKQDKLPSLPQCKKLIDRTPCLSGRKPLQIISMLQYQQRQVP